MTKQDAMDHLTAIGITIAIIAGIAIAVNAYAWIAERRNKNKTAWKEALWAVFLHTIMSDEQEGLTLEDFILECSIEELEVLKDNLHVSMPEWAMVHHELEKRREPERQAELQRHRETLAKHRKKSQ